MAPVEDALRFSVSTGRRGVSLPRCSAGFHEQPVTARDAERLELGLGAALNTAATFPLAGSSVWGVLADFYMCARPHVDRLSMFAALQALRVS
jgi:hypothetical protein